LERATTDRRGNYDRRETMNSRRKATDEEILADLRRVADERDSGQLTMRDYDDADGIVTAGTVHQRFGTWTAALDEIDLEPEGDDE